MTSPKPRYPTISDFEAKHPFCCVYLTADEHVLEAHPVSGTFYIEKCRGGELRIGGHGTIGDIELGVFRPRSHGEYYALGYLLDYAENKDALLEKALGQLEEMRATYISRLKDHLSRQTTVRVSIRHD
jgi:hypothetical protein